MAVVDAEVPITHRVWVPNGAPGRHGIDQGQLSDPIDRFAVQVYPLHWRSPHADRPTIEEMSRTVTDLLIEVENPALYKKQDTVQINGVSFEVQGLPDQAEWGGGTMLFPQYDDMFGGTVHVRRVT